MYLSKVDLPLCFDHALLDFFAFTCWISLSLLAGFLCSSCWVSLPFFCLSFVCLLGFFAPLAGFLCPSFVFLWLFSEEEVL